MVGKYGGVRPKMPTIMDMEIPKAAKPCTKPAIGPNPLLPSRKKTGERDKGIEGIIFLFLFSHVAGQIMPTTKNGSCTQ